MGRSFVEEPSFLVTFGSGSKENRVPFSGKVAKLGWYRSKYIPRRKEARAGWLRGLANEMAPGGHIYPTVTKLVALVYKNGKKRYPITARKITVLAVSLSFFLLHTSRTRGNIYIQAFSRREDGPDFLRETWPG